MSDDFDALDVEDEDLEEDDDDLDGEDEDDFGDEEKSEGKGQAALEENRIYQKGESMSICTWFRSMFRPKQPQPGEKPKPSEDSKQPQPGEKPKP